MSADWGLIIATGSAIFAGIGLILNWTAIRESNKTRQVQLLNDCFKDFKATESLLYKELKNKRGTKEWN